MDHHTSKRLGAPEAPGDAADSELVMRDAQSDLSASPRANGRAASIDRSSAEQAFDISEFSYGHSRRSAPLTESARPTEGNSPASSPMLSMRVLLVEDHDDTRRVLARLLGTLGCLVTQAATVGEALALGQTFDLLISDIGLPDGSGIDVIRAIQERYPIRGIAFSGFCQVEDARRSRAAGFETHLTKPLEFRKLADVVCKSAA